MNRSSVVLTMLVVGGLAPAAAQTPRLTFQAFSDVNYITTDRRGVTQGFTEGQFSPHAVISLTDRLGFYGEATVTAQAAGPFRIDIQRTILRYDFSNAFKVSGGRFHTPISYWNTSYHHGPWLQTTTSRPQMTKFGNSILPSHFVGVMAEGSISGSLGLGYAAGIGNGRQIAFASAGDAGDANRHRAVVGSVRIRPELLRGLELGGNYYRDRVPTSATTEFRENIWGVHVAWMSELPEFIAEYSRISHEQISPATEQVWSSSYYVQLAARLPGLDVLKPYTRFERVDVTSTDLLLVPLKLNYNGLIVGLRYDFTPYAALKGEYRNERFDGEVDRTSAFQMQVSFTLSAAMHAMAQH